MRRGPGAVIDFYDDSFATLLAASPEVATELGISEIGGRRLPQDAWADDTPAGTARRRRLMRDTLAQLAQRPAAGASDALHRQVYEFFLRWAHLGRLQGTESERFELCDSIADHLSGVQVEMLACLTEWQPLDSAHDTDCYLGRLAAVPRQIDTLIDGLRARQAVGNVLPACIVRRVVAELSQLVSLPLTQQPVYRRFAESGDRRGLESVAASLESDFVPAYRRLLAWLTDGYPREEQIGLCRLRDGSGYYQFLLKAHTTTDLSAAEIHAVGRQELERLQQSMAERLRVAGYAGGALREQLAAFNADGRFSPAGEGLDRDGLLRHVQGLVDDAAARLMPLFGLRPRAGITVRPIPEVQEANRGPSYVPPGADGTRDGTFLVNLTQLASGSRLDLQTLVYHEAVPGHHVQLAIAQELGGALPAFRRILVHDGYIEGWAKYAELLPSLAGINVDAHWEIARGQVELYSTANLVLDTGIHSLGWSREAGIGFFAANTGCNAEFAASIVDRIVARPAQVCAYKIGLMAVLDARARMKRALGRHFDLRRFHDVVLGQGSLPLALLECVVDAEIEGRAAAGPRSGDHAAAG